MMGYEIPKRDVKGVSIWAVVVNELLHFIFLRFGRLPWLRGWPGTSIKKRNQDGVNKQFFDCITDIDGSSH
jgi:hypothetical protein